MKLRTILFTILTALIVTGCTSGKFAAKGESKLFDHSFVGVEKDDLTKRSKGIFLLNNKSKKNIVMISGTYQILDKDGTIIQENSFNKSSYPYLLMAGEKKKMPILSGTLPTKATAMRIKVTDVKYK